MLKSVRGWSFGASSTNFNQKVSYIASTTKVIITPERTSNWWHGFYYLSSTILYFQGLPRDTDHDNSSLTQLNMTLNLIMSNKFTCSFPEFNFPDLPLLVKGIEVKNCSVKYAVSLQIIALSKFGCIAQWLFLLKNKTAATTKTKLTSSCVKLTLPLPPRPSSVCAFLFSKIQWHLELKASETI